jgi:hypothetical protein
MAQQLSANAKPALAYRSDMTAVVATRETRECAFETKFLVARETGQRIRDTVRGLLAPDPYASGPASDEYSITSIYFDTGEFAVYHRRGSYRRAKYRVRRYGRGDIVFLERKLRTADVLSKRRTGIRLEDLPQIGSDATLERSPAQWFAERLRTRRLSPVCVVSYRRTARVGMTDYGPIRLTIDDELVGAPTAAIDFETQAGFRPLTDRTIVELKFRAAMPAVFRRIVEDFALRPARVSKYRLGMEATHPSVLIAPAGAGQELHA